MAGTVRSTVPLEAIVVCGASSGATPPVARDGYARMGALLVAGVDAPGPRTGGLNQSAGRNRAQNRVTRLQTSSTARSMNPGLSALALVVAPPNRPNTGPTGLGWVFTGCDGGNGGSVFGGAAIGDGGSVGGGVLGGGVVAGGGAAPGGGMVGGAVLVPAWTDRGMTAKLG